MTSKQPFQTPASCYNIRNALSSFIEKSTTYGFSTPFPRFRHPESGIRKPETGSGIHEICVTYSRLLGLAGFCQIPRNARKTAVY
jgi:hypothetical protein